MANFDKNWTTDNKGFPLDDEEVRRYISVFPSENQIRHANKPFYAFIHFGMNTATGREWGTGGETCADFTIESIDAKQWVSTIKKSGATGIILTCKHHDGFCLWHTLYSDFCVAQSPFKEDIVKMVSDECHRQNMDFGIYLSPWDMSEETYGTPEYNDYFCNRLEELLTNYGEVFEVWLDGAKGSNAVDFEYDWGRYYNTVRTLQPKANIAICGPDIRWVGNEDGRARKSEYSVVPASLRDAEKTMAKSQKNEKSSVKFVSSKDEDLGSRKVLKKNAYLAWYPAEVDVSIRRGWFYSKDEDSTVKSANELFDIYMNSVGNNCYLLLNVPPTDKGVIHKKDSRVLEALGKKILSIYQKPVLIEKLGALSNDKGYIDFKFDRERKIRYVIMSEDISHSQRIEAFDLYAKTGENKFKKVYSGTVVGARKIMPITPKKCDGMRLVIRQSRSNPVIKSVGFYE